VGLLNAGNSSNIMTLQLADAGITGTALLRDVWAQKDLGEFKGQFETTVPKHGIILLKISQQAGSKKRK
jgi:alpha-galactosidase